MHFRLHWHHENKDNTVTEHDTHNGPDLGPIPEGAYHVSFEEVPDAAPPPQATPAPAPTAEPAPAPEPTS